MRKNTSMHKIAVVIPKYGLVGGAEQFAAQLTDELSSRQAGTFQVFANEWEADSRVSEFHKIPVISFPKFLTTISFAWFVERRLRRQDFSLVHSHERIFGADLYTMHGVPHRYWVHNVRQKSPSLYDRATAWVERKLVYEGGCRKFVAVSNLTRDIFLQEYAVDPRRVAVIHPGVHLPDENGRNKEETRLAVRSELGIAADAPVIIFASMNFEIKGLDDIIRTLAHLRRQGIVYKLIVAGKGNAKKYQKMAAQEGIADSVFFTGVVAKAKLIDLYWAGDLYLMLSKFDTFGMVVLEAMAGGLPVMISSRVGAKDLVREGENGFVIGQSSDYEYTASRLKLLLDEGLRRKMSRAAFQTAAGNTWDRVAAKYSDLYREILDAKRGPRQTAAGS